MTDIREMLQMMAGEAMQQEEERILPEAAIERMKEVATRIKVGNPFKEGDIVTARSDGGLKSPRAPMLVIETCEGTFPKGDHENGDWPSATDFDVKLLRFSNGSIIPSIAPHWMLELYEI
jgi:hypothetical protein